MDSQEIITIQLGEYSNHIGANLWNLRNTTRNVLMDNPSLDVIDDGVYFRRKVHKNGEVTWNPRVLAIDLKKPLDFSSLEEEFPIESDFNNLKLGTHQTQKSLDEGVSYSSSCVSNEWGDVLHQKFDSHSLHLIHDFHHENPLENFTHFNYGIKYMEKEENMEIIENQIRYFVEECNTFQGFQILLDADNGFGGIGARLLQSIKDEFPRKITFVVPTFPVNASQAGKLERTINIEMSIESLFEDSSILAPMSLDPNWCSGKTRKCSQKNNESCDLSYSSGILASVIDTITLPLWTATKYQQNLYSFESKLSICGCKAIGVTSASPFPSVVSDVNSLKTALAESVVMLTPGTSDNLQSLAQILIWRGISDEAKFEHLIGSWEKFLWGNSLTSNCVYGTQFTSEQSASHGGLHHSKAIGGSLKNLYEVVSKVNVKKLRSTLDSGLEEDDLYESRNRLGAFAALYDDV